MAEIFGQSFTRQALARHIGDSAQLFGVELVTYADGPERGVRSLRFRTGGGLEAEILVDRAMDVGAMSLFGVPLGWRSGNGFRHPWLHEHDAEGGLGWLRSFSGLMNTCGLDHIMGMAEETAEHFNYPYRAKVSHGIHGRVAFTPARLEGYGQRWEDGRCTLYAHGRVRQVTMFGENLELERRIEAEVGGRSLTHPRPGDQSGLPQDAACAALPRQFRLAGRGRGEPSHHAPGAHGLPCPRPA